jgi:hypothetical protein
MIPRPGYFEFSFPLHHLPPRSSLGNLLTDERYRLPDDRSLQGERPFAVVAGAWNERGLHFAVEVVGRKRPVQVDAERFWRLDCLELWIDTRGDRTVRQATRFCHQFYCLPLTSQRSRKPKAGQVNMRRARENSPLCDPKTLQATSEIREDGYRLLLSIPAEALTGYDPVESPNLGLAYHLNDVDFGMQAFPVDKSVPVDSNPSLWAAVELAR